MSRVLIVIFIIISNFVYSQNNNIRWGIQGGWNYSNVNAIDEKGEPSGYVSDIIDEVYGGVVLEKQFTSKSYFKTGILFSYTESVNFLELPIYYKNNFYKNFSFFIGPKLNYIPDVQNNNSYYFRKRLG